MRRVAAALAVLLTTLTACSHTSRYPAAGPPGTIAARGKATAADMSKWRWTELPPPPIAPRQNSDVAWTGTLMLVWGGSSYEQFRRPPDVAYSDGADYDPRTRQWRVLPPSPLGERTAETAVWTGREWVIWGGFRKTSGPAISPALSSGYAYEPVKRHWRRLASSPLAGRYGGEGEWTGREVIFLGGQGDQAGYGDGAAYNPAADRWRVLARFPAVKGHSTTYQPGVYHAVWTGTRLLAWRVWWHFNEPQSIRSSYQVAYDLASYDPTTDRWRPIPAAADAPTGIGSPVWTGSEVFVPSTPPPTPYMNMPPAGPNKLYDPVTNRWKPAPFVIGSGAVWTGATVVQVVTPAPTATFSAPFTQLAAWDPGSDHWTSLPRAPQAAFLNGPVWTGHELLYWRASSSAATPLPGWSFGP